MKDPIKLSQEVHQRHLDEQTAADEAEKDQTKKLIAEYEATIEEKTGEMIDLITTLFQQADQAAKDGAVPLLERYAQEFEGLHRRLFTDTASDDSPATETQVSEPDETDTTQSEDTHTDDVTSSDATSDDSSPAKRLLRNTINNFFPPKGTHATGQSPAQA